MHDRPHTSIPHTVGTASTSTASFLSRRENISKCPEKVTFPCTCDSEKCVTNKTTSVYS